MGDMARKSSAELPSSKEIAEMMAIEAQRLIATDRSFPDFETVMNWGSIVGVNLEFFKKEGTIKSITEDADRVKSEIVEKTLAVGVALESVLKAVTDYLGEEDALEKADLAIAFGDRSLKRAEKAAELYIKGYTKKLLMCGRSPNYTQWFGEPEALVFKKRAMELGVPEEDILTEEESINIPSNVRASLNLLDGVGYEYNSVIQVISWYAQRRVWCAMKKYLSPEVKLIRVNSPMEPGSDLERDRWFLSRRGIEIVFNEFVKMKIQETTKAS